MTSDEAEPLAVHMAAEEQICFSLLLKSAQSYVEFGTGGSTVLAASVITQSIVAIDSSREWLDKVASSCTRAVTKVKPRLVYADIGPTGEWGRPIDGSCMERWGLYSTEIWKIDGADNADLYLVDGRFRVACFMETMMRCRADAIVVMHDYAPRAEYHIVEQFARPILVCSNLSAFVRRSDFDRIKAAATLERFRYISG
jgi:hypothetical protein